MLKAALFDLDDTLLTNDISAFLKHYFPLLAEYASERLDKDTFIVELLFGTQAMMANQDRTQTNQDVFWTVFCQRTGLERSSLEPFLNRFYEEEFGVLREFTGVRPVAADLLAFCREQGLRIAIATNPLFPRTAILQRLGWAGVPAAILADALVTSYENMHATKPHAAYYLEILEGLGVGPAEALMVGDDWDNDIRPAADLGLSTFWVSEACGRPPDPDLDLGGCGSLDVLYSRLQAGWLSVGGAEADLA